MHGYIIIDESHVAALPGDVETQFLAELRREKDGLAIERTAIAEGDRSGRVVAGVFPSHGGGDELIEDVDGEELPDLDSARSEAIASAREILSERIKSSATADGDQVEVCDESGKVLATESVFQAWAYAFKLGTDPVVMGWTEGLQLFKQGGKGTLYIPGFLAYGENPGPAGKPFASLIFDVEILQISDEPIAQDPPPAPKQTGRK